MVAMTGKSHGEARMATSRLGSSARPVIEGYLAAPTEKVLAARKP